MVAIFIFILNIYIPCFYAYFLKSLGSLPTHRWAQSTSAFHLLLCYCLSTYPHCILIYEDIADWGTDSRTGGKVVFCNKLCMLIDVNKLLNILETVVLVKSLLPFSWWSCYVSIKLI